MCVCVFFLSDKLIFAFNDGERELTHWLLAGSGLMLPQFERFEAFLYCGVAIFDFMRTERLGD